MMQHGVRQRSRRWSRIAPILAALLLAACAQTSRVSDGVTPAALTQSKKAVAVMRIGSASPACINAGVMLAQRERDYFRATKPLIVANIRSVTEPAVAEVELDPGEYHVVAYSCKDAKGAKTVADKGAGPQAYHTSYASFTLAPGEIVNVGYLHLEASHIGRNAFGRPVRAEVDVTDWPLAEIDRFKAKRPTIYAQMITRLMTVTPPGPTTPGKDDCARLATLKAEGKVQAVPASCTPAAGTARTAKAG